MRDLTTLDRYRIDASEIYGWSGDGTCGAFRLPSPVDGKPLMVIAASGAGWDHVSVSRATRPPNWPEMEFVKRRFFRDEECAMQLHVPVAEHIDCHPHTLHLWRPQDQETPRPPAAMV